MKGRRPIKDYYVNGEFLKGYSMTRLYAIWSGMKERCYNPKNKRYAVYGMKGISICEKWNNDFKTFAKWAVDNGYEEKLTIDRIDVSKGYGPENCRWITIKEQENNRSNNHRLKYNGETHTVNEWSEITGIKHTTLHERLRKGWSIEKTLTAPVLSASESGKIGCEKRWHSK